MGLKLTNNAVSRLASGITAADTSISVTPGDGAKFPSLAAGDYFPATLIRASDGAIEVVRVTARATDVLTVTRAQESTAGIAFVSGDRIELRLTAAAIAELQTNITDAQLAADNAQTTANAALPKAGGTMTGNLGFNGTGRRITGDFSSITTSSRVLFQTSTANSETNVGAIPNGTNNFARFTAFGSSDPTNASLTQIYTDALNGFSVLRAGASGTGTNLPLSLNVNGLERMRIDTSGNALVTNAGGLGYGAGAGGTVTQATSKATAVTLNKPTGGITMNTAALAASTSVSFTLNNSLLAAADLVIANIYGPSVVDSNAYRLEVRHVAAGACVFRLTNISAGSLSEAVFINFTIIKGAVA